MTFLGARILERTSRMVAFRTAEVAQMLGVSQPNASRALATLQRDGLITRVKKGLWANTRHPQFTPYRLVPLLTDEHPSTVGGYVSVISAMALHGMISQIPAAIHVATRKQRRSLNSPVGEFRFHRIDAAIFDGYAPGDSHGHFQVATPAKALFDTLYLSVRRGRRWRHLPEVELPRSVTDVAMQYWISRLSTARLRVAVNARWKEVRAQIRRDAATAN